MVDFYDEFKMEKITDTELENMVTCMKNPNFLERCMEELDRRNTIKRTLESIKENDCWKFIDNDIVTYYKITKISSDYLNVNYIDVNISQVNNVSDDDNLDYKLISRGSGESGLKYFYNNVISKENACKITTNEYNAIDSIYDDLDKDINKLHNKYIEEIKKYL